MHDLRTRTAEDRLRDEYFTLLPHIRLTAEELEGSTSAPSLRTLNDLAGVRVLAFPKRLLLETDSVLRNRFGSWIADPVPPAPGTATALALKYHGY